MKTREGKSRKRIAHEKWTSRKSVIHPERCTGCMLCVLACSFHHTKRFDRRISSVAVSTLGKEREMNILIHEVKDEERQACDNCQGERIPLCVRYCPTGAIVRR